MKDPDIQIHHNNLDIVQRLMAETMKGFEPLNVFGYHSKKVKEVLSTDLPDVETVDDKVDAYYIIRNLQELADESLKAHLSGMIYVLVRRFLSEEGEQKIWEVLIKMSIVEKELKKRFGYDAGKEAGIAAGIEVGKEAGIAAGKEAAKKKIFTELVEAIKEGDSERSIQRLIRSGDFTDKEIEEAYQKAAK